MLEFIVGFLVALLSGLGIGGGGLLVIYLVLVESLDQLTAQSINLTFFLFSSTAAMLVHLTKRRLNFKLICFLAVFGCVGAILGSKLAADIDPTIIKKAFGILLLASGIFSLFGSKKLLTNPDFCAII